MRPRPVRPTEQGGGAAVAGRSGSRLSSFLGRRDPGHLVIHRAVRVTAAASLGFFLCRYGLGDPNTAVYALFGTVALGALSEVTGTPGQRTRTYLAALVVGLVLVSLGTLLAVSTWAAAAGMLVIGFAVAYAGVGGPRVAGVATGLQLFYVLPCFPPYMPDMLDERLTGLAVGVLLLTVADRLVWPPPAPPQLIPRVAAAAGAAAAYAAALRASLDTGCPGSATGLAALRDVANRTAGDLRLSTLPPAARPTGAGRHDRSVARAALAVRVVVGQLDVVADRLAGQNSERTATGPAPEPAPDAAPDTAGLLAIDRDALEAVRAALLGTGAPPAADVVDRPLTTYVRREILGLAGATDPAPWACTELAVASVTEAVRALVLATRATVGAPPPSPAATPADLWFLHVSSGRLWWLRLVVNLTPRSVYLQNAVRLALGLAVARVVAGVLELSHGFWVLLATLSLMRTSAVASRPVLVRAFAGTVVGAIIAALVLALVGSHATVYAWLTPLLMLVAFAAGPLLGLAAGQAGFTVVVAVVFAQVAPANWTLAEDRLLAVVVGGLVGAVIGAAVWPRGGAGEVHRVAADCLHAAADEIVATAAYLTGSPAPPPGASLERLATLFEHTYIQYRSEPCGPGPEPDWLVVLTVSHRLADQVQTLRARYPQTAALPWPDFGILLRADAEDVAAGYRVAAAAVAAGGAPARGTATQLRKRVAAQHLAVRVAEAPVEALRAFDAWGWLHGLVDGLEQVEQALDPPPVARPVPAPAATRG
ncbi:FUSC family protein [Pseudonocardia xinjiangensis]